MHGWLRGLPPNSLLSPRPAPASGQKGPNLDAPRPAASPICPVAGLLRDRASPLRPSPRLFLDLSGSPHPISLSLSYLVYLFSTQL